MTKTNLFEISDLDHWKLSVIPEPVRNRFGAWDLVLF